MSTINFRFQTHYLVLAGDIVHLCDTSSQRAPALCGALVPGERVGYLIDAPTCPACLDAEKKRQGDPVDAPWRKRYMRRLEAFKRLLLRQR
jgi:hypothetical protein